MVWWAGGWEWQRGQDRCRDSVYKGPCAGRKYAEDRRPLKMAILPGVKRMKGRLSRGKVRLYRGQPVSLGSLKHFYFILKGIKIHWWSTTVVMQSNSF